MTNRVSRNITDEVDVAICGGGPVGLSMAYLLGRAGLRTALFERRASTTTLPKGQYLHASTAEFFRQWGVWDLLGGAGWSTEASNGQGFYVNVANGPVAEIRAVNGSHEDYMRKWELLSPAYPRKVPASDYESAIRRQTSLCPSVTLHFNARVIDVENLVTGVRLKVQDTESRSQHEVRARFVMACDGAHSFVRSCVGKGEDHGPTFGNQILVEFRAALDDTLGRDGFFHSFVLNPLYAGWFGSKHPDTGLWRYSFRHDEEESPQAETVLERIRGALGMPDLPVEITQFYRFDYSTGLLRNWREGNIFFVGDAAHWHSPWGGFGMNSGIQDANNLAWKLDLVVKGIASDALLDTYQVERRSKALVSVKSATYNSLHYQAIAEAMRVGEGAQFAQGLISSEAVTFLRQRIVSHGENSVLHTGYQLGTVYDSTAIVREQVVAPTPSLSQYVESTVPGVRAPHAWLLQSDGSRVSTIDLWGRGFVLVGLRMASCWLSVCTEAERELGLEISLLNVGEPSSYQAFDMKFARLFAAQANEVTLVRPDGFVAARFNSTCIEEVRAELTRVLRSILGLDGQITVVPVDAFAI